MRFLFPICLALLLLTSCKKDAAENYENTETVDATLIWSDPAVDGCGFALFIGHEEYKPVNENDIPESYKAQLSTAVEATIINYHKQVNSPCGFNTRFTNSIKILSLRKNKIILYSCIKPLVYLPYLYNFGSVPAKLASTILPSTKRWKYSESYLPATPAPVSLASHSSTLTANR